MTLREVDVTLIRDEVERLFLDANYVAGEDVREAFAVASQREVSPLGKRVLIQLIDNMSIAANERVPMCQDTGTAVVFLEIGQDVHLTGGALRDAVNEGVRRAYTGGYLRPSIVARPIGERVNTRDNTPAILHIDIVDGDAIQLSLLAKGGGAENMSQLQMLTPSGGRDGVVRFVVETVERAGPNACPPLIVGVGIGGTFDSVGSLAKHTLTRAVGSVHSDPEVVDLECELMGKINALGIGPHGFGGRTTALAVHVEIAPTHIASLPVAVNLQCGPAARLRRTQI